MRKKVLFVCVALFCLMLSSCGENKSKSESDEKTVPVIHNENAPKEKSVSNAETAESVPSKFIKQQDTLTIVHCEWGKYAGKDLPEKGFYPDLVGTILRDAGYKVRVKILPWVRCIEGVKAMDYDIVCAVWESERYSKDFVNLNNTTADKMYFIALKGSPLESGEFSYMKGQSVAITRGSGGTDNFYKRQKEFNVFEVTDESQMVEMLQSGRVSAVITDPNQFEALLEKKFPHSIGEFKTLEPPIQINYNSPMLSIKHPLRDELIEKYDKSYRKLVKAGIYEKLARKHGINNVSYRPLD